MMLDKLESYEALLATRQKARYRDTLISGALFFAALLSTIVVGLLFGIDGRATYVIMVVLIAFGLSYSISWARLEIVKHSIDLLHHLQRAIGET